MIPYEGPVAHQSLGKPRASGDDPWPIPLSGLVSAVNPARAGMIPDHCSENSTSSCKPRASGDDPPHIFAIGGGGL